MHWEQHEFRDVSVFILERDMYLEFEKLLEQEPALGKIFRKVESDEQ